MSNCRQISGAMIRISNSEELREGCSDRVITITGNPDSVALAQYLINMRYVISLHDNNAIINMYVARLMEKRPYFYYNEIVDPQLSESFVIKG